MKDKRRSERRFKTQNIINRRKHIIKDIWKRPDGNRKYVQENRLNKYNFTCSCSTCRADRAWYNENPKAKYWWHYHNYDME